MFQIRGLKGVSEKGIALIVCCLGMLGLLGCNSRNLTLGLDRREINVVCKKNCYE